MCIIFWLLMNRSNKKFVIYAPEIIEISTLAYNIAHILLPHMINYEWCLVKKKRNKEMIIEGWVNLKTSNIHNGDEIYLQGHYIAPEPDEPVYREPPPKYPQKANPSMLYSPKR